MVKKELLRMRPLRATARMLRIAENDIPRRQKNRWGHEETVCKYGIYLRCAEEKGILKVALFLPEAMRLGSRLAAFEVYIDRPNSRFLTWDRAGQRWLTAKLDRLDLPFLVWSAEETWISPADDSAVKRYLDTEKGGFRGVLDFQRKVREQELAARHKRESDPWDDDLAQVPPPPKDWERWVSKVGIPENYIFYRYERKGAVEGYCTYCERTVPIVRPRHNKAGRCSRCRREITFKSVGKYGPLRTSSAFVYLIQRCRDGFVVREFRGSRFYPKGDYLHGETSVHEVRRSIYDHDGKVSSAYYWGLYKQKTVRWIKGCPCPAYRSCWFTSESGRVYGKTLPSLARRELSHTGLPELLETEKSLDPEHYLSVLEALPLLEKLAKARLPRLTKECIGNYYRFKERFGSTDATRLIDILGLKPGELKRLRAQNGGLRFLDWLRHEGSSGVPVPDHVAAWFCAEEIEAKDLQFIADRMTPVQIYGTTE